LIAYFLSQNEKERGDKQSTIEGEIFRVLFGEINKGKNYISYRDIAIRVSIYFPLNSRKLGTILRSYEIHHKRIDL